MNKKIVFFICLIVIILSAACVSAAEDVTQTNIGDTSNLDANGDILAISSSENEILGADEPGTFTELQAMVNSGNATINLTKDFQWDDAFTDYAIKIKNPITINGNGHTIDALNQNDLRIFEINNVNSGIILDNITFKNGNTASQGGAINIISALSDSKFTNLNFINNTAKYNGGAVRFYRASENNLFENITFINNTGIDGNGGALYMTETSTSDTFKNIMFANNVATSNTGKRRDGGAINFHDEVDGATFDNVLFSNNRAEKSVGGAINIDDGIKNSIFNNSYFIDNAAKTGGAIGITGTISSLTFENTQFINNTALVDDGGAINIGPWLHSDLADTTFKNVLFENNTAAKEGGAIYVTANTLSNTFENVEFINNTAGTDAEADRADGGAIKFGANYGYTTEKNTFKNVNFTNNTAKENGGALYVTGKSSSNTFENVDFINNVAKTVDGGAINFYKLADDTTFEEVLFYKNSAPGSGGGALNFDNGMENTRFTNTLFVENSALYTSAIAINGNTSSNTIESSVFYNNTATNYLIYFGNPISDNIIRDSIIVDNDARSIITKEGGLIELTDNWFGNNATNYDEDPDVFYVMDNWLFLNATANPAAITLNQTSTVTFKFSSFKDGSGVEEYDGPVYAFLQLNSTLGTLNRTVALTDDEIVYTPSESGNGSVTGTFLNKYYTVNIENDKIPTEISVENSTLDMLVLDNVPAGANLTPADAGYLSYNSSNSSVAVAIYGRIVAVGEGSAIITVSFEGDDTYAAAENKTIEVTVSKRPTEISVENSTLDMLVLDNVPAGANLTPADAGYLSYNSSNSSVAVAIYGRIVAVGEGSAIITVSFEGDEIYAAAENKTIEVTVSKRPTEITLLNDTLNVTVLEFIPEVATLDPAEAGNLSYSSSNSSIVQIFSDRIIPVGEGSAIITVSFDGDEIFAAAENKTITVNVRLNDASVSVDNDTLDLFVEDTYAINATTVPDFLKDYFIKYSSSNESVATVDNNGTVTAVSEGTAIITVEVGDDKIFAKNSTTVTVTVSKIPTEITVENTTLDMAPLDFSAINATLTPDVGDLKYNSTNSSVAIVLFGNIIAIGEGEADIIVYFEGDDTYAASEKVIEVTVTKIPTEITVENTTIEMNPFDVVPVGANLTPGLDLTLTYTSSNSSVATVILGEIVALSEGEATITVSFDGNIRYAAAENKTIDVIVTKIPTEITVENTTIEMAPLDIAPAGANLTNASNLLLTYTSSNSSVATVILGEIIALSEGKATITVSFNGTTRYAAAENKTIEVIVTKIPTEITIENATIEMAPLDIAPAGANLINASNLLLTYTSSNSSVAIVVLGEIIAVGEGEATITVSFNGTTRYVAAENKTIEVIVNKIPTEITVENSTIEMAPFDIVPAGADLTNASNLLLTYTSSNSSVAIVVLGEIIAVGEGEATITVSFNGTTRYVAAENKTINVIVSKIPTEITVENATIDMKVLTLTPAGATLTPEEAGFVTYTSSNSSVAAVVLGEIVAISPGEAIITVSYGGSGRYLAAENKTIKVTVSLWDASVSVDNDTLTLLINDTYSINPTTAPSYLPVNYTSSDESVATVDENGTVTAVGEGTAIITVSVGQGIIFAVNSTNVTVTVNKIEPEVNVTSDDDSITVELTEDATGEVTLIIGNETLVAPVEDGVATFDISDVPAGDYNATITYPGDDKYVGFEIDYPISIEGDFTLTADDVTKYYGGSERFVAVLTDGKGNPISNEIVTININGQSYERTTNDKGQASMAINLNSGEYPVVVSYNGTSVDATVTVLTTVNGTDITKVFRNETQYFATFRDSEGNYLKEGTAVRFNINGVMYDRKVSGNEGLAKLNINLNPGTYIITAYNLVTGEETANNITVLSRITENKDITKYYRNGTQYTAKIIGDDGKAVGAGETVTFNIHGVFYERQTDANGIVKLNINLEPGDYIITAEYKGCMAANNIKVLPTLTADDLTKQYGTPDPFVANLVDGQGNPYADQKIEFNINGVFYYRPTDSAGQAKLNINLMAGQYIITSSYNGAVIGNTVTIVG